MPIDTGAGLDASYAPLPADAAGSVDAAGAESRDAAPAGGPIDPLGNLDPVGGPADGADPSETTDRPGLRDRQVLADLDYPGVDDRLSPSDLDVIDAYAEADQQVDGALTDGRSDADFERALDNLEHATEAYEGVLRTTRGIDPVSALDTAPDTAADAAPEPDLSPAEAEALDERWLAVEPNGDGTYLVTFADGFGVYEPGEAASDVATATLDSALDLGLVSTTVHCEGPHGPGSLRDALGVDSPGWPAARHAPAVQERVAVLDYLIAHAARTPDTYETNVYGEVTANRNRETFPERSDGTIRSDFVVNYLNRPLSPDLVAQLRSVDPLQVADLVQKDLNVRNSDGEVDGLRDPRVKGMFDRMLELQEREKITGEAWLGDIRRA